MLTNKDYCDYETSITLGELGFPLKRMKVKNFIDGEFSESIVTVLLYEAQKWLREAKGKHIEINLQFLSEEKRWYWGFTIIYLDNPDLITINGDYSSYEEALFEGIKEAIKILKEKLNEET